MAKAFITIALAALTIAVPAGGLLATEEVDINRADRSRLEQLPGIGVAKADAILLARDAGGAFISWSDFQKRVRGFGPRTIERLQSLGVYISETHTVASPHDNRVSDH